MPTYVVVQLRGQCLYIHIVWGGGGGGGGVGGILNLAVFTQTLKPLKTSKHIHCTNIYSFLTITHMLLSVGPKCCSHTAVVE